jgi:hypothetical protein
MNAPRPFSSKNLLRASARTFSICCAKDELYDHIHNQRDEPIV